MSSQEEKGYSCIFRTHVFGISFSKYLTKFGKGKEPFH